MNFFFPVETPLNIPHSVTLLCSQDSPLYHTQAVHEVKGIDIVMEARVE